MQAEHYVYVPKHLCSTHTEKHENVTAINVFVKCCFLLLFQCYRRQSPSLKNWLRWQRPCLKVGEWRPHLHLLSGDQPTTPPQTLLPLYAVIPTLVPAPQVPWRLRRSSLLVRSRLVGIPPPGSLKTAEHKNQRRVKWWALITTSLGKVRSWSLDPYYKESFYFNNES